MNSNNLTMVFLLIVFFITDGLPLIYRHYFAQPKKNGVYSYKIMQKCQ